MAQTRLAHNVFFALNDNSEDAKTKLTEACKKYLTGHPGTDFFTCGILAADYKREVNDRDFDVSLHIVFATKEDHDAYQVADRHNQFIEENKDNWKHVRVFDSLVD